MDALILSGEPSPTLPEALIERIAARRVSLRLPRWHRRSERPIARAGADSVLLGAPALPVHDALVPVRHERAPATPSARSAGRAG